MAKKNRGLGRGLDVLLGATQRAAPAPADSGDVAVAEKTDGQFRDLPIDLIQRGKYQPRVDMHPETLEDLANSIRAQGVVQPIVVRPIGGGRFEIIAGERRWRASQIAEMDKIPAIIREVPDEAAVAMALIENIQREELNPIEEAVALQRLIDEFEMTHLQAAEAVGRSRAAVTNLLRLLTLTDEVKNMLTGGQLEMGHARALLTLTHNQQVQAARNITSKGLSVREAERLAKSFTAPKVASTSNEPKEDPNIVRFEQQLSEKLGAKVKISHTPSGKGKLEIHYNNLEELDGILAHIK